MQAMKIQNTSNETTAAVTASSADLLSRSTVTAYSNTANQKYYSYLYNTATCLTISKQVINNNNMTL